MHVIFNVLSNPWTISIISPMFVAFFLYHAKNWFSKISKHKKIDSTRTAIVNYLEKLVTNGTSLDNKKMSMIVSYFLRKYNIDKKNIRETAVLEDLLVRIYSIDYIQLTQREEILVGLENLHTDYMMSTIKKISYNSRIVKNNDSDYFKQYKRKFSNIIVIYIYIIFFSIFLMLLLLTFNPNSQYELLRLFMYPFKPKQSSTFIAINLMIMVILLVLSLLSYVYVTVIRPSTKTNKNKR